MKSELELEDFTVLEDPPAEIKIENDVETCSVPTCRICSDCQPDYKDDETLISPCMCEGTQQFVHRSCLDHWRSLKEDHAFSHCTTCKAQFHLRVIELEANSPRKTKFRLFVARNVFFVFLAIQIVIGLMAGVAYLADKNGAFRNCFSERWDRVLSRHPIPFYYCIGAIAFIVLVGIVWIILRTILCCSPHNPNCCYGCGTINCFPDSVAACFALLIIYAVIIVIVGIEYSLLAATIAIQYFCQRHYHILIKRELTREYVVEDVDGDYAPPELDPKHMESLKKLELL